MDGKINVWMVSRDVERESKVSVAYCPDLSNPIWTQSDLTDFDVRSREPSFDRVLWQQDGILSLYVQKAGQGDGETLENVPPQPVHVLDWEP